MQIVKVIGNIVIFPNSSIGECQNCIKCEKNFIQS